MFKLKKKTNKIILIGFFVFNFIILLSFIFDFLISYNILSSSLAIFTLPIKILSSNFTIVILFLFFEVLLIGFSWFNIRKENKTGNGSEDVRVEFDFLLDETEENNINTDVNHEVSLSNEFNKNSEDYITEDSKNLEMDEIRLNQSIDSLETENQAFHDEDEIDLSPGFLANNEELLEVCINKEFIQNKTKETITDYQFALYQTIVNNNWLYENSCDRKRIGFDNNAINESQISLSDLNLLIKSNLIYRKEISHPSGSFFVYTANPNVEKEIIHSILRRICLKNKLKLINRKIDFINWKEFGLIKKTWQFDLEIPHQAVLIAIWTENAFINNNTNISIKQDYIEELKAIFA
ncbi:MAG: hypothetical protein FK731_10640, partial [Asgard group archaeon]|nr:hypothetical protein [Asgard group archaeon]